ncbi:hypothetical protein [Bradyrhizobium sp. AUGA SZCCT0182]|uniref:hypothetical protein n=1 Tax=Bradyrhizobium sp. AUGA SZCCT0182 TaxID=2807667 RepID=UPI001BA7C8C1|nr:hypothetical protein [Bradyrhizobium sp. AUGA SZCCT0182]MBR1233150.1 hypothetical protein [Bradyrhizobium sp. AUGA SZCCT0182]
MHKHYERVRIAEAKETPVTYFSRLGTYLEITVLTCILGDTVMASSARIFFAGVGTTFVILGVGFGSGLLMANSALKERSGYQARTIAELPSAVRVILPTTAEAAQPPQPPQQTSQQAPVVDSAPEPVQATQPEKRIEKPDAKKAEAEVRERRKRYAERKSRREAARAKQRLEPREHEEAPVMAFGGDATSRLVMFGN